MKRCSKCGEMKPLDEFHNDKWSKDGKQARCKACRKVHDATRTTHDKKPTQPIPVTKMCAGCGEEKPLDAFAHRHKRGNVVPRSRCRACEKAERLARYAANPEPNLTATKARRVRNPEYFREYMRRWRANNRNRINELVARRSERIRNAPVVEQIDRDAIVARDNSTCYLCGRQLATGDIHIDHVVPLSRGGTHTADNLRVACQHCNNRKYNKLLEELDWYIPGGLRAGVDHS